MTPTDFLITVIDPGLTNLNDLGGPAVTTPAARFMLAIALTESGPGLIARYQNSPSSSPGPARGFWQFEQSGGVAGVIAHASTAALAQALCDTCTVQCQAPAVWRALEGHDVLAAGFARLLITTEPRALPTDPDEAYDQYLNLWRPGKPCAIGTWYTNWQTADDAVREPDV